MSAAVIRRAEQTADRPLAPFSERFELALWLTGDYTGILERQGRPGHCL